MAEVRMPKMGDGMEEGKITSWLKHEGDAVHEGEDIAEVETDKANVAIPAEESGVLSKIVVSVGETVPVGAVIAQIGGGGGNGANGARQAASSSARQEPAPQTNLGKEPAEHAIPPMELPPLEESAGNVNPEAERIKASPLARRLAEGLGVDLARVEGTGPGGRIVERDIKAFQARHAERPAPPVAPEKPVAAPTPGGVIEFTPSKMRAAIARRTVQSAQTAPHFYTTMVIEMDRALTLLKELNADGADSKVTINDLLVKACVVALGKTPQVNAAWTPEGNIRQFAEMHIGIAVGIEDGLVIPVIRNCESKTLRRIAAEAKALIAKARSNQLKPESTLR